MSYKWWDGEDENNNYYYYVVSDDEIKENLCEEKMEAEITVTPNITHLVKRWYIQWKICKLHIMKMPIKWWSKWLKKVEKNIYFLINLVTITMLDLATIAMLDIATIFILDLATIAMLAEGTKWCTPDIKWSLEPS